MILLTLIHNDGRGGGCDNSYFLNSQKIVLPERIKVVSPKTFEYSRWIKYHNKCNKKLSIYFVIAAVIYHLIFRYCFKKNLARNRIEL